MAAEIKRDPDLEWLDHVRPVGLVVAPALLKELGLAPSRQTQADTAQVAELLFGEGGKQDDLSQPVLRDPWSFAQAVLGWDARHVAGSPGGPPIPAELSVRLPEHDTTLEPTWAVKELGATDGPGPAGQPWQLLVRIEAPGVDPGARGAIAGWEATPHQRFERLLRESGVHAGLLITERNDRKDGRNRYLPELRLVYAPRGETSGYLTFQLRSLTAVAGRPMLGGLKLLLDSYRLFNDADDRRLPALLRKSREAQAAVSTALAEQVLGALHELLRGLDAAAPEIIRAVARERPGHLYEGLLTVLMRLVFILYAEDRDLLPSRTDGRARQIYETSYSLRGLYARLFQDSALNPDTMDERRGGWGQLLALFRLIHKGHKSHFVQARGGKLFDPDQFPFLEGRAPPPNPPPQAEEGKGGGAPSVLPVSDGCMFRILEGLTILQVRGGARERLSYRTLDVEQIGSVYETVMGFAAETAPGRALAIKAGKNNRTPVFVDLDRLAAAKGKDRIKFLKEEADRGQLSANVARAVEAAEDTGELAAALDAIVDERASPKRHVIAAGTPILQPTDERRRTGSHYTPRSLTEPIVRHALEPAFERLGRDATPEQLLDLKVCDPAMGSGAFLVEACRANAARLVDAWSRFPEKRPAIPPDEDEELHARRLVAQRCLYGVDKNPLATDLAKLSLWLATLARDHEFTFLDHALKSGDSLVGLTPAQIASAHWDASKPGLPLFRQLVKDRVAEALKGRAEIQAAPDDTARAIQEARHRSLEEQLNDIRLIGNAVIAAFFAEDKLKAREKRRAEVESWLGGSPVKWDKLATLAATLKQGSHPLTPFHWEIEFPEVFARPNGGFDSFVGNPPFLGGPQLSRLFGGPTYQEWLKVNNEGAFGNADLSAYFFRRAFSMIRTTGTVGLMATNSISEGGTRTTGLQFVLAEGGIIYRATRSLGWPGEAAVFVAVVHIAANSRVFLGQVTLDNQPVPSINSRLLPSPELPDPEALKSNDMLAFMGTGLGGSGFILDEAEYSSLAEDPKNRECLLPYLNGEILNSSPTQTHERYAINFAAKSLEYAKQFPSLLEIVSVRVKPDRDRARNHGPGKHGKKYWWQFTLRADPLHDAISGLPRCLAAAINTPHLTFSFQLVQQVFAHTVVVFAFDKTGPFACLQSRAHFVWAKLLSSSLKDDLRYSVRDAFQSFPFPKSVRDASILETAGKEYYDFRARLMIQRNEGLTKTYNRFHDPRENTEGIQRLRELHTAMDRAVLETYTWCDLAARAEPMFLNETNEHDHTYQGRFFWASDFRQEVLSRLLALNAERHAEEVRLGIAPRMRGKARKNEDDAVDEHY